MQRGGSAITAAPYLPDLRSRKRRQRMLVCVYSRAADAMNAAVAPPHSAHKIAHPSPIQA